MIAHTPLYPAGGGIHYQVAAGAGEDYFTTRLDPERETRRLIARLEALGHAVTLEPAAA